LQPQKVIIFFRPKIVENKMITAIRTAQKQPQQGLQAEALNKIGPVAVILVAALLFANTFTLFFVTLDEEVSKLGYLFQSFSWDKFQKVYSLNNNLYNVFSFAFLDTCFKLFGYTPKGYHFISWLLHTANTGLVFYFVWLLTQRNTLAFVTALLFAIHPTLFFMLIICKQPKTKPCI
jgi:hypothetical protein